MNDVFIAASKRTPIGGFLGALSSISATQLGAAVIRELVKDLDVKGVDAVYMGNVLSAGLGQSPARQAALVGLVAASRDSRSCGGLAHGDTLDVYVHRALSASLPASSFDLPGVRRGSSTRPRSRFAVTPLIRRSTFEGCGRGGFAKQERRAQRVAAPCAGRQRHSARAHRFRA